MKKINSKERIILALDSQSVEEAKRMVLAVEEHISFFKVGIVLHTLGGREIIQWLVNRGKKIFLDLKFYDIENTIRDAVRKVADLGVSFLTVHGHSKLIRAAVEGKGNSDMKILAVTVLTTFDNMDLEELNYPGSMEALVLNRVIKSRKSGCDGVIASPNEVKLIRREVGDDFLIVTPGIRPEGVSTDDQKRIATPGQAIKAGSDYLVIGRPILKAPDPKLAIERILTEIENVER